MISGHLLWSWKGRNSPFQPFQGSSNTQTHISELLCPPQGFQPLLPVKGSRVKMRNSSRDTSLMVASRRGAASHSALCLGGPKLEEISKNEAWAKKVVRKGG